MLHTKKRSEHFNVERDAFLLTSFYIQLRIFRLFTPTNLTGTVDVLRKKKESMYTPGYNLSSLYILSNRFSKLYNIIYRTLHLGAFSSFLCRGQIKATKASCNPTESIKKSYKIPNWPVLRIEPGRGVRQEVRSSKSYLKGASIDRVSSYRSRL